MEVTNSFCFSSELRCSQVLFAFVDHHDSGTVGSHGDISVLSHHSQSTMASSIGLSNQMANRAFHIDVVNPDGSSIRLVCWACHVYFIS
jgi:hypothetical protein